MNEGKFKIVIIGDTGVGKTCIIQRLIKNQFEEQRCSTIGAAFYTQKIVYKENNYNLEFWDTAGQERFRAILPLYFRNVDILIIVIDVTSNIKTQLEHWINYYENIHFFDKINVNKNYSIILLFSKIDLVENEFILTIEEQNIYKKYILDENILFMSSKKNIGFKELKNTISENIYKIYEFKKDNNFQVKENINLNEDTSYNHLNYYKNLIKKKCNYL
jgi:small GTP-binding protein